jgi:predicted RNase H-like HicB family nuclease
MVFKVVMEPSEAGGYTVWVPSLPGCVSEGETVEEAMANIREAIELHLEPVDEADLTRDGVVVKELVV